MLRIDRILALNSILANRRTPVSRKELEEKMGCSTSTAKRRINALRDYLHHRTLGIATMAHLLP